MARKREKPMSRKIGYGDTGGMIYQALRPIRCTGCPATIAKDQLFTRSMMTGGGSRTFPFCRTCQPFKEREDARPAT